MTIGLSWRGRSGLLKVCGFFYLSVVCSSVSAVSAANASTYTITPQAPDLVGQVQQTTTVYEDTIPDVAMAFDQGYREMILANPKVSVWVPGEGTTVVIPSQYVIPAGPREGIVVNVPEMRLYLFARPTRGAPQQVTTFPVSVGRQQWVTPKATTTVIAKVKDPAWYPPESIRREHAAEGDPLPKVVPPGPENPLGAHALRLGLTGYLIHGTDKPYGIGMRVTHGCLRLYPKDAASIFDMTAVGTKVRIVNQPFKIGIGDGRVFLEVHPHLEEDEAAFADQYSHVVKLILERVKDFDVQLVWTDIRRALELRNGIPQVVGSYRAKVGLEPAVSGLVAPRFSGISRSHQ